MKQMNWKELPFAGTILEGGNAEKYKTGSWRSFRPKWVEENCIHCLFCWIYCPDSSVIVKDEKMAEYRISIEADSMAAMDWASERDSAVQFMQGLHGDEGASRADRMAQ